HVFAPIGSLTEGLHNRPALAHIGFHFFGSTSLGLQELAYLQLGRLLDSHRDSVSIFKFINFVEQNPQLFANADPSEIRRLVQEHRRLLDAVQDEAAKVRPLRDTRYAHGDSMATSQDLASASRHV